MKQRESESSKRLWVKSPCLISSNTNERKALDPVGTLVLVLVHIVDVGSEEGSGEEGEGKGESVWVEPLYFIPNHIDEKETLKAFFILVPILVLVFVLGGVLVSAPKREGEREREEAREEK